MTSPSSDETKQEPLRHTILVGLGVLLASFVTTLIMVNSAPSSSLNGAPSDLINAFAGAIGYSLVPATLISLVTRAGLHFALRPNVSALTSTQGLMIMIGVATLVSASTRIGIAVREERIETQAIAFVQRLADIRQEQATQLTRQIAAIDELSLSRVRTASDVEAELGTIRAGERAIQNYVPNMRAVIARERATLVGGSAITRAKREALTSFERGFNGSPDHVLIALQIQRLQKIEGALTLLQTHPNSWSNEGGHIVISDNALLAQMTTLLREASALHRQIVAEQATVAAANRSRSALPPPPAGAASPSP